MFYKKEGEPEESEIILCEVTKVQHTSVFVKLVEYPGKSGLLHISEVSPGRIRNIRDYVKEGKVIVCKVLKIDKKKGHIDVSLRRVNEGQRKEKVSDLKQEQKAEKIIEFVAKELKGDTKKLYDEVFSKIKKDYDHLFEAFNDYVVDKFEVSSLGLDKKTEELLSEIIKQRIKPPKVEIKAKIKIECYDADGVEKVKSILQEIEKIKKNEITVYYLGAGTYMYSTEGEEYKSLEKWYSKTEDILEKNASKTCTCTIERQ